MQHIFLESDINECDGNIKNNSFFKNIKFLNKLKSLSYN